MVTVSAAVPVPVTWKGCPSSPLLGCVRLGALGSTSISSGDEVALVRPPASVSVAVSERLPSGSWILMKKSPFCCTLPLPTTVLPSKSVTVSPASPVPCTVS